MHYQKEKECIAVGCVPSAAVAVCWGGGGGLLQGGGVCCRGVGVSAAKGWGGGEATFPCWKEEEAVGSLTVSSCQAAPKQRADCCVVGLLWL